MTRAPQDNDSWWATASDADLDALAVSGDYDTDEPSSDEPYSDNEAVVPDDAIDTTEDEPEALEGGPDDRDGNPNVIPLRSGMSLEEIRQAVKTKGAQLRAVADKEEQERRVEEADTSKCSILKATDTNWHRHLIRSEKVIYARQQHWKYETKDEGCGAWEALSKEAFDGLALEALLDDGLVSGETNTSNKYPINAYVAKGNVKVVGFGQAQKLFPPNCLLELPGLYQIDRARDTKARLLHNGEVVAGLPWRNGLVTYNRDTQQIEHSKADASVFTTCRAVEVRYKIPQPLPRDDIFVSELEAKLPGSDPHHNGIWCQALMGQALMGEGGADHNVIIAVGPGGSGKSTIQNVLCGLIGVDGVHSARDISDLGSRFGLSNLAEARLLVIPDTPKTPSGRTERSQFNSGVAALKAITGSDPIQIEKKYKATATVKVSVGCWISTNHSPKFVSDPEDADSWERRLAYLNFCAPQKEAGERIHDYHLTILGDAEHRDRIASSCLYWYHQKMIGLLREPQQYVDLRAARIEEGQYPLPRFAKKALRVCAKSEGTTSADLLKHFLHYCEHYDLEPTNFDGQDYTPGDIVQELKKRHPNATKFRKRDGAYRPTCWTVKYVPPEGSEGYSGTDPHPF